MKKLLLFFTFVITSLGLMANSDKNRIERLVQPYEQAISFIIKLDEVRQIQEHDIFLFFNANDLHEKKNIKRFDRTLRIVKRLIYSKKSLLKDRAELEHLVNNLEKIQKFVVDYAATYYALVVCHEITVSYYYIDEQNQFVASLIATQPEKLGLSPMRGRGLYKFVKKIDLDLRRLTALFTQNIMTDSLAVKANQIKTKLIILKNKIVESSQYRSQLSKTRWLKAFGVVVVPALVLLPIICISVMWSGVSYVSIYAVGSLVVTIHEMRESTKYNIPVHSTSIFSWFMPVFWPLTWIPRA